MYSITVKDRCAYALSLKQTYHYMKGEMLSNPKAKSSDLPPT